MAEECAGDHEKSMAGAATLVSGTPSPRGAHGIGTTTSSINDNTTSSTVSGGSSGIANSGDPGDVTATANETTATTTMTATTTTTTATRVTSTSGAAAAASSIAATSTGSSPSTWTSATDGATAGAASVVSSHSGSRNNGNGNSPRSPKHLPPRKSRVRLSELQLETATREEWAAKWREQDLYIECLEAQAAAQEGTEIRRARGTDVPRCRKNILNNEFNAAIERLVETLRLFGELACLRDSEEKYKQQCFEASHRERILVRRLTSKEQQLLAYVNQITELKASQTPSASALRSALLDPAVNILIQKLRQELQSTKAKLEDTQNELSAWKFTPDSNTGKRLMAKCRLLYQENEELGRMIASGRIAKLEGELMLQKSFSEEVKKSQSELDEFLQDLDEDVEGMQSTIYFLQQELRKARESVSLLQQENNAFKSMSSLTTSPSQPAQQLSTSPQPASGAATTIDSNSGLPNGVTALSHTALVPKVPATNNNNNNNNNDEEEEDDEDDDGAEFYVRPPVNAKSSIATKTQVSTDSERDSCLEDGGKRAQLQGSAATTFTSSSVTYEGTKSDSPVRRRVEEPDESSNDSAALIIKVDNEELSDREEEEEEDEGGAATSAVSETRAPPPKQSRRTIRERATTKNEGGGANIGSRSNGEDRNLSRGGSRRLLRERTNKREKCALDSDDERPPLHKKKRRESILSLDYTETDDDALLLTNGESIQSDPEDGP